MSNSEYSVSITFETVACANVFEKFLEQNDYLHETHLEKIADMQVTGASVDDLLLNLVELPEIRFLENFYAISERMRLNEHSVYFGLISTKFGFDEHIVRKILEAQIKSGDMIAVQLRYYNGNNYECGVQLEGSELVHTSNTL